MKVNKTKNKQFNLESLAKIPEIRKGENFMNILKRFDSKQLTAMQEICVYIVQYPQSSYLQDIFAIALREINGEMDNRKLQNKDI